MSLEAFNREVGVIADLLSTSALLAWGMRTMMPSDGVEARGYGRRYDPSELIERANGKPLDAAAHVRYLKGKYEALTI